MNQILVAYLIYFHQANIFFYLSKFFDFDQSSSSKSAFVSKFVRSNLESKTYAKSSLNSGVVIYLS